ncbi:hypothetical protein CI109_106337 [Kwoniella shandongensis]|uniref:D-xylose 1-dehydrogenase (NADP(+), D-xylono-1,5-lactone-forming) n=1 Tax=Kwoniella shandongensis TaxID=1734106 RepID=A0A5M6BRA0_9TREE|nr:uncharacterized protein CI109_007090 [Kwoniella shandongensis]KAA5524602.1 hypothetical protein CI109_007090 [Kwoniella shandongensis]
MAPFTIRWGIISTGGISTKFVHDLLVDPSSREVSDVAHKISAVGSRSVESAQKFVDKFKATPENESAAWGVKNGVLEGVKAVGTYQEVYNDPDVDVIYVGTPHTLHHRNTKDALLAGKHVLCEKPFTLESAELEELIAIAKDKNLFLMEAVWTRYHPLAYAVEEVLKSGKLGKPKRFSADFSMDFPLDDKPTSHRMLDPALGGGSLLDMGPYPSVWAMLLVHRNPHNKDTDPKVLTSHQTVYEKTDVDINSRWLVEWKGTCQGQLMTDLGSAGFQEATAVLQCEEGDLVIEYPPYRSEAYQIHPRPERDIGAIKEKSRHHHPIAEGNNGMSYEADEVARCIRDKKTQSDRMPWEESKITQGWLDVVRTAGPTATAHLKGTAGQ